MQVRGFRRIFAHTAGIFFQRGIARPATGEISSLSCEECPEEHIVVTLFEIESTPESRKVAHGFRQSLHCSMACFLHCMRLDGVMQAYVEREHEFRFLAVASETLEGTPSPNLAVGEQFFLTNHSCHLFAMHGGCINVFVSCKVLCGAWNDEAYKSARCPPGEFERRYGRFGIDRVWR